MIPALAAVPCRMTYTAIASRNACQDSWPRSSAIARTPAHSSSDIKTVRSLRSFMSADRSGTDGQRP